MGACLQSQSVLGGCGSTFYKGDISAQKLRRQGQIPSFATMLFVMFPFDFASDIICSWLNLQSIVRMDSACCNVVFRVAFLKSVRYQLLHLTGSRFKVKNIEEIITWSLSRRAKYTCTSIRATYDSSIFNDLYKAYYLVKELALSEEIVDLHVSTVLLAVTSLSFHGKPCFDSHMTYRLVQLLSHPDDHIAMRTLSIATNLMISASKLQQLMFSTQFLPAFLHLLSHRNQSIRSNVGTALVNILSVNKSDIPTFIHAGVVGNYIGYLKDPTAAVNYKAMLLLRLVVSGEHVPHIQYLVDHGVMRHLCALLYSTGAADDTALGEEVRTVCACILRGSRRSRELHEVVRMQMMQYGAVDVLERLSNGTA